MGNDWWFGIFSFCIGQNMCEKKWKKINEKNQTISSSKNKNQSSSTNWILFRPAANSTTSYDE